MGDLMRDGVTSDIASHPANNIRRKRASIGTGRNPLQPRRARGGIDRFFDAALRLVSFYACLLIFSYGAIAPWFPIQICAETLCKISAGSR